MGQTRVVEAVRRVSVQLYDLAPQFLRFSEREIIDAMNEGQTVLFMFLPSSGAQFVSVKLAPGTLQSVAAVPVDRVRLADGSAPDAPLRVTQIMDFVCDMGADGATPGNPVNIVPRDMLDTTGDNWHTRTGPVTRSAVYDPQVPTSFFVVPGVPSSGAGANRWLRMSVSALPKSIPNTGEPGSELYGIDSASTETINVPDEYLSPLVDFTIARVLTKASKWADAGRAAIYSGAFTSFLNAKVAAMTGNNPNLKSLPLAPAPMAQAS